MNGNTNCSTSPIHADVSGDGKVDSGDFSFIAINYLQVGDDSCCPTRMARTTTCIGWR